ncbi:hypothetical protein PCE1_002917 [Barthelona sp. PCE]
MNDMDVLKPFNIEECIEKSDISLNHLAGQLVLISNLYQAGRYSEALRISMLSVDIAIRNRDRLALFVSKVWVCNLLLFFTDNKRFKDPFEELCSYLTTYSDFLLSIEDEKKKVAIDRILNRIGGNIQFIHVFSFLEEQITGELTHANNVLCNLLSGNDVCTDDMGIEKSFILLLSSFFSTSMNIEEMKYIYHDLYLECEDDAKPILNFLANQFFAPFSKHDALMQPKSLEERFFGLFGLYSTVIYALVTSDIDSGIFAASILRSRADSIYCTYFSVIGEALCLVLSYRKYMESYETIRGLTALANRSSTLSRHSKILERTVLAAKEYVCQRDVTDSDLFPGFHEAFRID